MDGILSLCLTSDFYILPTGLSTDSVDRMIFVDVLGTVKWAFAVLLQNGIA